MTISDGQQIGEKRPKRERILVADDQEMLRSILRTVLVQGGYDVVEASDGEEAVAKHAQAERENRFDLVLLDVQMPGLSGRAALQRMRKSDPLMRVLFLSGGLELDDETGGSWLDGVEFLPKPFDNRELLAKVRRILDL